MNEPFRGARLKIERAKQHIDDLNRILRKFLDQDTYIVFVEHDPNASGDLLKVRGTKTMPEDFVLVLGDALHNLRAALDYAMNDIEFSTMGERTTYTKFPVYDSREALEAAVNGGLKKKSPKQVIECIADIVQPYKGGDGHAIWSLHQLDIEDKHRLLIANTELNFIDGIRIEDDRGEEIVIPTWLVVRDKVAEQPIPGNRNVKVKNQGKATYRVIFGAGLALEGNEIIPGSTASRYSLNGHSMKLSAPLS